MYWSADSDSQLTKGLAALLVTGLSGCMPQEIINLQVRCPRGTGIGVAVVCTCLSTHGLSLCLLHASANIQVECACLPASSMNNPCSPLCLATLCCGAAYVQPDFFEMLGLKQSLTPGRNNGFLNILKLMQRKTQALIDEVRCGSLCQHWGAQNVHTGGRAGADTCGLKSTLLHLTFIFLTQFMQGAQQNGHQTGHSCRHGPTPATASTGSPPASSDNSTSVKNAMQQKLQMELDPIK